MNKAAGWIEVDIPTTVLEGDAIIALLDELPFNSFMEEDGHLKAYISNAEWTHEVETDLRSVMRDFGLTYTSREMPDTNWNCAWESNFPPVNIEGVCHILAAFHEPPDSDLPKIFITPKMAFGTGHHETTAGMLMAMNQLEWTGSKVLDFGSGTGILAIFAALKGARDISAIDIEVPSYENMQENFSINGVAFIQALLGGKEAIPTNKYYDVILANITCNVILGALKTLVSVLQPGGILLMSGFFETDLPGIIVSAQELGLRYSRHQTNGKWVVAHFIAE